MSGIHGIYRDDGEPMNLPWMDGIHKATEMLDLPLLHRCLTRFAAKVDPDMTMQALTVLVRGMGAGKFPPRLADSTS